MSTDSFIKFFIVVSTFLFFPNLTLSKEYKLLDRIAIIVEKGVITEGEIQDSLLIYINKNEISNIPKLELEKLRKDVTKSLIEKKLLTQYAISTNLTPTEQEIDKIIENILKNNQISIEELKTQLENDGWNINLFREDIKFNLTVQKIKDREIMPFVNVSEYEIDAWLKKNKINSDAEYKISHILIKKDNPNKEKVLSKINEIKKPSDFLKIAQEFSDGPNAENFGDLGWNKIEDLPEIFIDFVKKSKKGEISEAIESTNGIHFLQIESIRNKAEAISVIVKQYKFQQILLKHNSISSNEEQLKKMNNFRNLILDGLNFSKAVKLYSEDQFNIDPEKLEWISFNNLLPEFKNNLSKYPSEDIIGPFKTDLGWHLVKVYAFREKDLTDDAEKQKVQIQIARNKTEIRYQDWLDALIKISKIKYLNED